MLVPLNVSRLEPSEFQLKCFNNSWDILTALNILELQDGPPGTGRGAAVAVKGPAVAVAVSASRRH